MRTACFIVISLLLFSPSLPLKALDATLQDDSVVITVQEGVRRVRVEAIEPSTGEWHVVAIAHVDGSAGLVKIRIPAGLTLKDLRISTSTADPLPASAYSGQRRYLPQRGQDSGGQSSWAAFVTDGEVAAGGDARFAAAPTVEESDIWKFNDDLLYFFNNRRGLQIVDLAVPSDPKVLGVLPLAGTGEQMYVLNEDYVLLMMRGGPQGEGAVIVDVSDPASPDIAATIQADGNYVDSRLIGDRLYITGASYNGQYVEGVWESLHSTAVTAWDLANPREPSLYARNTFPGAARAMQATAEVLMVSTFSYGRRWTTNPPTGQPPPTTPPGPPPTEPPPGNPPTITADTDISPEGRWIIDYAYRVEVLSLSGPMLESYPMQYPHTSVETASIVGDKFKLHYSNGILTTISGSNGEGATLENWDVGAWLDSYGNGGQVSTPPLLGSLPLARGESTFGTRFDGDRVYIVTFLRVDPLWVIDNSNPAAPTVYSELEVPGWSTYLEPLGDRLLAIGVEDRHVTVSLFDVADPANTSQLSRVKLGDPAHGSWSEGNYDEKAITVLPDEGLVLLPFQSWTSEGAQTAMQLVDLLPDSVIMRGALEHDDVARRATLFRDHLVSISNGELLVADASNRDTPVIVADIDLSWAIDHVFVHGDSLLQLSSTTAGGYYYTVNQTASSTLRVTSRESSDSVLARLEIPGAIAGATLAGDHLQLIVCEIRPLELEEGATYEQAYSHLSIDVSDSLAPRIAGKASLGVMDSYGAGGLIAHWLPGNVLCWRPDVVNHYTIYADMAVRSMFWRQPRAELLATIDLSSPAAPRLLDFLDLRLTPRGETFYGDQVIIPHGQSLFRTIQSYAWIDGDYLFAQYLQEIDLRDPSAISTGAWIPMPAVSLLGAGTHGDATLIFGQQHRSYEAEPTKWISETSLVAYAYDGAALYPLHTVQVSPPITYAGGVFVSTAYADETYWTRILDYSFETGFATVSELGPHTYSSAQYLGQGYSLLRGSSLAALDLRDPANPRIAGTLDAAHSWWGPQGAPYVLPDDAIFLPSGYSLLKMDLAPATVPALARAPLSAQAQAASWTAYEGSAVLEPVDATGQTGALNNAIWLFRPAGYKPLIEDADDLGDATFNSTWFGLFWDSYYPWIYHSEFGWFYPVQSPGESFWASLDDLGWVWTGESAFPWLYVANSADWIAYAPGTGANGGTRWYYSFKNAAWFYASP